MVADAAVDCEGGAVAVLPLARSAAVVPSVRMSVVAVAVVVVAVADEEVVPTVGVGAMIAKSRELMKKHLWDIDKVNVVYMVMGLIL